MEVLFNQNLTNNKKPKTSESFKTKKMNRLLTKNKIRTTLLIISNEEMNYYLKYCNMKQNSISPKTITLNSKVYDGINISNPIVHNFHKQADIDSYMNNQLIKESLYFELLLNIVPDPKAIETVGRIKRKETFHRKDLDPPLKDNPKRESVPKQTNKSSKLKLNQHNTSTSINNSPNNIHTNNSFIMKSIYNHSKLKNDRKLEMADKLLNSNEKQERSIQDNIKKLKLIVHRIKGNINVSSNLSIEASLTSIKSPIKTPIKTPTKIPIKLSIDREDFDKSELSQGNINFMIKRIYKIL